MDINEIIRAVTLEICAKQGLDGKAGKPSPASIASYIDHTLLKPEASESDIRTVCDEAKQYHFASVCVNPSYIRFVAENLAGSGVTPCCVVGFPLGATTPESKANETKNAVNDGAKEIDMVLNVGAAKTGDWKLVARDIEGVVQAAHGKATVKVIIETCLLTDEEKVKACTVSKLMGAHFVKTSTGFSKGGATAEDVRLMRQTVGPDIGVKASGGVKTYEDAINMIEAGANRLGTSSGISIVSGTGSTQHKCSGCGACNATCPSGRTAVIKDTY